jgi:hypothetical protein
MILLPTVYERSPTNTKIMLYTVTLRYIYNDEHHYYSEYLVYEIHEIREFRTFEDACAAFVSFAEMGERTRPFGYWVEMKHGDLDIVDLWDSRRLTISQYPEGLEAARAIRPAWIDVEVYAQHSNDPVDFAEHVFVCVECSETSIRNAMDIFRKRCSRRLYTTFTGEEQAVIDCCSVAVQYGGLCSNIISSWEPVKTTDSCVDAVNYI